jgi:hypothetical protein
VGWAPTGPVPPPQPWPQQPPASPEPPKRGGNTALIVVIVAVVLLAVAGGGWFVWHRLSATPTDTAAATDNPAPGPSAAGGTPESGGKSLQTGARPGPNSSSASASSTSAGPAPDAEQQALGDLQAIRDESVARVPLDGRWVAQVASKSVGITDPLQTAANGTHTFYATDILAEVQNLQATVGSSANLYLVWGTDFGKRSTAADGSPYWTTLADAGLASQDDVTAWCAATFPSLSADQLADQCAARQLNPPHD